MASRTKICPICGKTPRLRNDGSLYQHKNLRGTWCAGGGQLTVVKHKAITIPASAPETTTHSLVDAFDQILNQSYKDLTGHPVRALWEAVDDGDPLKLPCPMCGREIGWRFIAGTTDKLLLARHKHPQGGWCSTTEVARPAPSDDNGSGGVTGAPVFGGDREPERDESPLARWWRDLAEDEIAMVVAKANEYGATDLRDLGYQVLDMAGRRPEYDRDDDFDERPEPPTLAERDAQATEIGIAFYTAGKLARIIAAIKEGRRPSYDSWHDVGIYARMAQRVHTHGGWPA